MKLTQPAGCHDNPNQSLVSFHIRKVQSHYLKPYTKLRVTIFETFKKMVGVLSVQAGVQCTNRRQNDLQVDAHRQRFVC